MRTETDFLRSWSAPPGRTVQDLMSMRNISRALLARSVGITIIELDELIAGDFEISPAIAIGLEKAFGAPASFWVRREANYRAKRAILENAPDLHDECDRTWLKTIPLKQMIDLGWIHSASDSASKFKACLEFFGVPSVSAWRQTYEGFKAAAAFRSSTAYAEHVPATVAWLRRGELLADAISCAEWNAESFFELLPEVRNLTRVRAPSEFVPKLQELCAKAGVAVVVAKAPVGCRASGATFFSTPSKAVVLLSARYRSDDHFWFSFFHEAGHLILHDIDEPIIEIPDGPSTNIETEANKFSADLLIPPELRVRMKDASRSLLGIVRLARDAGVSNGIVVGQMQHLGLVSPAHYNNLKTRYQWSK